MPARFLGEFVKEVAKFPLTVGKAQKEHIIGHQWMANSFQGSPVASLSSMEPVTAITIVIGVAVIGALYKRLKD